MVARLRLRTGPLLMMAASASFVLMTLCIKTLRAELSGPEVVMWRGLLSLPLLVLAAGGSGLRIRDRRLFALRVAFGFAAMTGYAIAAKGLSLVDIDLVSKLRPLIIAVAAPLVLGGGERVGGRTWIALTGGFAGCAVLLAPELAVGSAYSLWALGSVLLSAGAHLCLRGLAGESARAVVFWFHAAVAVLGAGATLVTEGALELPAAPLWPWLVGVAAAATAGQLLMTRAYAVEVAPTVAAATYTGPVWALLGDVLVWDAWPAPRAWIGGAMVVTASIWLVLRRAAHAPPRTE